MEPRRRDPVFRFTEMEAQLLVFPLPGPCQAFFLLCSRPWLLPTAAEGGLEPVPADRFRGAYPQQLSNCALLSLSACCARGARLPVSRKELQEQGPFGLATPKPTLQRKFSTV